MRSNVPGLVALALLGWCVILPAAAELSEGQAASLILEKTGFSVEGLHASRTERPDGDVVLTFRTNPTGGPGSSYYVNATSGTILGWSALPQSEHSESAPSEDKARGVALATARKVLGPEADSLLWRVSGGRHGSSLTLDGKAPVAGDPPRRGLTPEASVTVFGDGSILTYSQYVPTDADSVPLRVSVSRERAVEIASEADSGPEKDLIYATLEQRRGKVWWEVQLGDGDVQLRGAHPSTLRFPSVRFTIDAQTGKILEVAHAASERGEPRQQAAGSPTGPARSHTPWPAVTGAVLLCMAAVGVVVVARRRVAVSR